MSIYKIINALVFKFQGVLKHHDFNPSFAESLNPLNVFESKVFPTSFIDVSFTTSLRANSTR